MLVWDAPEVVTPPVIAERLADIPEATWSAYRFDPLARPAGVATPERSDVSAEALGKARAALREGAWQEAVVHLDAAAQHRHDHDVISLIDDALQAFPELADATDQAIEASIVAVRAALQAWDLEQARSLVATPPANAVIQRRQLGHARWEDMCAEVSQRSATVLACQTALTQAKAQQHDGDLRGALQTLRPFDAQQVGPELAPVLLTARQQVLTRLLSQARGDAAARQQYAAELEQATRDLAAIQGTDAGMAEPVVAVAPQVVMAPPLLPLPQLPEAETPQPAVAHPAAPAGSTTSQGWLDEALARSRERLQLRQRAQAEGEGAP